jgi:hypothetical protein
LGDSLMPRGSCWRSCVELSMASKQAANISVSLRIVKFGVSTFVSPLKKKHSFFVGAAGLQVSKLACKPLLECAALIGGIHTRGLWPH